MSHNITFTTRVRRHIRLTLQAAGPEPSQTPPFLILFINSICNLTCEHCFYWRNLNRRDDLTFEEIRRAVARARAGREPEPLGRRAVPAQGVRGHLPAVHRAQRRGRSTCRPTATSPTRRTRQLQRVLENQDLWFFVCELSLDGMPEYHDRFRGNNKSFAKAMETYDALAELQAARSPAPDSRDLDRNRREPRRDSPADGVPVSSAARRWTITTWR